MNQNDKTLRSLLTEKYLNNGIENMSDSELVSLLLSYTSNGQHMQETANNLLNEYGSLNSVIDADIHLLMKNSGIDEKTAVLLKLIPQLSRIIALNSSKIARLSSSKQAKEYFSNYFIGTADELLAVVCTDEKMNITDVKSLAYGSSVSVSTSCRKIVEFAIKNNSSHIFIAHNHPIGNAEPSSGDLYSTEIIYKTLKNIGITLVDHIITSKDSVISIKELPYTEIFDNSSSCNYIFNS